MLSWLVDNAGLFYFLLGLFAAGLAAAWWMTRQVKYLLAVGGVGVLVVLIVVLALLLDTDQKKIERTVKEMAEGVRAQEVERISKHLSRTFTFNNMKYAQFREYAEQALRRRRAKDVTVSKFSFPLLARAQGQARVEFWAHTEELNGLPLRCEADFVLEDGSWRMKGLEFFQGNTRNKWPLPATW